MACAMSSDVVAMSVSNEVMMLETGAGRATLYGHFCTLWDLHSGASTIHCWKDIWLYLG